MNDDEDEARREKDRVARSRARQQAEALRKDVQDVFASSAARRLLMRFVQEALLDASQYRENAMAMAHAVGWKDGATWWLDLLRQHCPEREPQMRNEEREAARVASQEDDDGQPDRDASE